MNQELLYNQSLTFFPRNSYPFKLSPLFFSNHILGSGILFYLSYINHVWSTNGKNLKRRIQPHTILKIAKYRNSYVVFAKTATQYVRLLYLFYNYIASSVVCSVEHL